MTDLTVFTYDAADVRTFLRDGEPWFVAPDICSVLGIGNPRQAVSYLDDDEVIQVPVITNDGSGRELPTNLVSEAGLYSLILRSRKPEAKAFKRWITHEVLPAIRKTGRFESTPAIPQTYAEALQLAADQARQLVEREHQLLEAAPKVEAWDQLASADGDYAVADAAKMLSRNPQIVIGRNRLFSWMSQEGWIYRRGGDKRWAAYQRAVDPGWLAELPSSHYHPGTGELLLDPPQVRVTPKGLAELHRRLTSVR